MSKNEINLSTATSDSKIIDGDLQPKTRFEYFLNKIAESKGGSGSNSSDGSGLVYELSADSAISFPTNTFVTLNGERQQISNIFPDGIEVSDKKPLFIIAPRANDRYQMLPGNNYGYITLLPYGEPASEPRGDEFSQYTITNEIQVWSIGDNDSPFIGFVPEAPTLVEIEATQL